MIIDFTTHKLRLPPLGTMAKVHGVIQFPCIFLSAAVDWSNDCSAPFATVKLCALFTEGFTTTIPVDQMPIYLADTPIAR